MRTLNDLKSELDQFGLKCICAPKSWIWSERGGHGRELVNSILIRKKLAELDKKKFFSEKEKLLSLLEELCECFSELAKTDSEDAGFFLTAAGGLHEIISLEELQVPSTQIIARNGMRVRIVEREWREKKVLCLCVGRLTTLEKNRLFRRQIHLLLNPALVEDERRFHERRRELSKKINERVLEIVKNKIENLEDLKIYILLSDFFRTRMDFYEFEGHDSLFDIDIINQSLREEAERLGISKDGFTSRELPQLIESAKSVYNSTAKAECPQLIKERDKLKSKHTRELWNIMMGWQRRHTFADEEMRKDPEMENLVVGSEGVCIIVLQSNKYLKETLDEVASWGGDVPKDLREYVQSRDGTLVGEIVNISTAPPSRKMGVASGLLDVAGWEMKLRGLHALYGKIRDDVTMRREAADLFNQCGFGILRRPASDGRGDGPGGYRLVIRNM